MPGGLLALVGGVLSLGGGVLSAGMAWLLGLVVVPSTLGFSLGLRKVYMQNLLRLFQWATCRMERGRRERLQSFYKTSPSGLIKRESSSNLEEEVSRLRDDYDHYEEPVCRGGAPAGDEEGGGAPHSPPPTMSAPATAAGEFTMSDAMWFARRGLEAIVEDDVTQRFSAEELESWNLLTRTNCDFSHVSAKLTAVWGLGVLVRYFILLPVRVSLASLGIGWLVVGASAVGFLPQSRVKEWLSDKIHLTAYRICLRGLSGVVHYHNTENRPRKGGICVANHTSPIDVVVLAADGCYAMVGQVHGGLLGVMQRAMQRACFHVWFERSEMKDRHLVTQRLMEHVAAKVKLPILIFPEGTCINNTSVMMFKKGSFEIGGIIYPVAIKYDPQFGDAFWNSSKYGMVSYLLRMMTSWAIVCNVWYLPPMTRQEGEEAVVFANRVKAEIARQGGLVDLIWDGQLKRGRVKDSYRQRQQERYSLLITGGGANQNNPSLLTNGPTPWDPSSFPLADLTGKSTPEDPALSP
ncbi:glycerol-3-phosphate acyltransferase 3-like [Petromyzon marinus]|uniref:Glycerol-3-phosphate acyltransferase 3-like n=1 Tax=Petromyzon marinus TaxID=7757 RepID=A0AAJ7WSN4_PETMA|nr:glycerol-3-phosphate acyltransferase 3-like [Petromyzon marinus]